MLRQRRERRLAESRRVPGRRSRRLRRNHGLRGRRHHAARRPNGSGGEQTPAGRQHRPAGVSVRPHGGRPSRLRRGGAARAARQPPHAHRIHLAGRDAPRPERADYCQERLRLHAGCLRRAGRRTAGRLAGRRPVGRHAHRLQRLQPLRRRAAAHAGQRLLCAHAAVPHRAEPRAHRHLRRGRAHPLRKPALQPPGSPRVRRRRLRGHPGGRNHLRRAAQRLMLLQRRA